MHQLVTIRHTKMFSVLREIQFNWEREQQSHLRDDCQQSPMDGVPSACRAVRDERRELLAVSTSATTRPRVATGENSVQKLKNCQCAQHNATAQRTSIKFRSGEFGLHKKCKCESQLGS